MLEFIYDIHIYSILLVRELGFDRSDYWSLTFEFPTSTLGDGQKFTSYMQDLQTYSYRRRVEADMTLDDVRTLHLEFLMTLHSNDPDCNKLHPTIKQFRSFNNFFFKSCFSDVPHSSVSVVVSCFHPHVISLN